MTDLTEQWKKGELKKNKYWVKYKNGKIDTWELSEGITIESKPEIIEVLSPVPSYEEWKASENYIDYLKQCISVYESKDKQATETSIAYNELAKENEELKEILERHKKATAKAQIRSCDLEIINQQLKELLKECREILDYAKDFSYHDPCCKCIAKINQALGEK